MSIWKIQTANIHREIEQKDTGLKVNNAIRMMIGSSNLATIFSNNLRKIIQEWRRRAS